MDEEIFQCIGRDYSTFEEYFTLIEKCEDLSIRETFFDGGYRGLLVTIHSQA